jgi:arabinosaccharide transport system substrate-binding protein
MSFPLGKAPFAMICLAIACAVTMSFRHPSQRADLRLWVFAEPHARMYCGGPSSLVKRFQSETGKSVSVEVVATAALDVRLLSMFMSRQHNDDGPDLAEVEISSVGKYLRPPARDVGFMPLNAYLERSGWIHRILPSRLAPWSKDGMIFGIPHDLHPCTLSYRKDLFDQAGVDLERAQTWPEFQDRCLAYQQYWQAHGQRRIAIGLPTTSADMLTLLLLQQHVNLVNADLSVHLLDENVLSTLMWYAQAVAGPRRIGTDFNPAPGQDVRDLASGEFGAMITPDWQVGNLKTYAHEELAGRLRMMPLPRFSAGDARTSTWGGTMIGITRQCRDPDLAWRLIETLYLSHDALAVRQSATSILPPIPEYWSDPAYQRPDPFYAGQQVDRLFLDLADEVPPRYVTPYTSAAQLMLATVLNRAVAHVRDRGDAGLEQACRGWLARADADVREMIEFDRAGR